MSENSRIYDLDGKSIIMSKGYLGIYKDNSKEDGIGHVIIHGKYDIGVFHSRDNGKTFYDIDCPSIKIEPTKDEMGNTKYKMISNSYQEDNFELLCLVPMIKLFPTVAKFPDRDLNRMLSHIGYKLGLIDKTSYVKTINFYLRVMKSTDKEFEHKLDQLIDEKEIAKIKQELKKLVNNNRRNIMDNINTDAIKKTIDASTDFGKGIMFYTCDGQKVASLEQVMQYNQLFYKKIKKQQHLHDIKSNDSLLTDIKHKSL